jgi:hypothetical protein
LREAGDGRRPHVHQAGDAVGPLAVAHRQVTVEAPGRKRCSMLLPARRPVAEVPLVGSDRRRLLLHEASKTSLRNRCRVSVGTKHARIACGSQGRRRGAASSPLPRGRQSRRRPATGHDPRVIRRHRRSDPRVESSRNSPDRPRSAARDSVSPMARSRPGQPPIRHSPQTRVLPGLPEANGSGLNRIRSRFGSAAWYVNLRGRYLDLVPLHRLRP